jgi:hypothetical protein
MPADRYGLRPLEHLDDRPPEVLPLAVLDIAPQGGQDLCDQLPRRGSAERAERRAAPRNQPIGDLRCQLVERTVEIQGQRGYHPGVHDGCPVNRPSTKPMR